MLLASLNLNSWLVALVLNAILIGIAQRLPLLTREGWVHAGILGTILWGCLGWQGWLAVVGYLVLGSMVTRLGMAEKTRSGLAEARGGRRGPENIWGSAATGALLALFIGAGISPSSLLKIGFAASFAAKLADTFGSEIGKRWGQDAFLITTFAPVPRGTDGAISLEGTIASAIGSLLMTSLMAALYLIPWGIAYLVVAFVGLVATLLESLVGAVAQNKIDWLTNELVNGIQTLIAAFLAMFIMITLDYLFHFDVI